MTQRTTTDTGTASTGDSARRTRERRRPSSDGASSSVVGFLAAGALFAITMAFTVQYVANSGPAEADLSSELETQAREALEMTVEGAGLTDAGNSNWQDDPDALERFGLSDPDRKNVLEWEKLDALQDGKLEADDTNDAPDYPEVRDAMGLSENTDFHLRTEALFVPMESSSWGPSPNTEVAYVAQGEGGNDNPGNITSNSSTAGDDLVEADVTVENNGTQDMIYKVTFEVETDEGLIATDDQYTPMLSPGETTTVAWTAYEVDDWDGSTAHVNATLYDAWGNEFDTVDFDGLDLPADADDSSDTEHNFIADPGDHSYGDGETPVLYLDHYDHAGDRINEQGDGPDARLAIVNPSGTEIVNRTVTLEKNKALEWTCDDCDATGGYTVSLMTTGGDRIVTDNFRNASTDEFAQTKTPTDSAEQEMGLIDDLVAGFENSTHDAATHDGDVYVDDQDVLANQLVDHLSSYDILVVGSNVDHNAMTSGGVKWPIHDWVTEEGGHLIALGNTDPNTQWLQPLYGSGATTASGGVSTPDPTHPVLHAPEELDYKAYDDHDTAWKLRSNADDYYTHVLQKDSSGSQTEDTLASSRAGAFGNGSVTLSAYQLHNLTDPQDDHEAKKFLRNMLVQAYQMVYVDFGPEIPTSATVSSQTRTAMVPHPSLPANEVEVKAVLYVWR